MLVTIKSFSVAILLMLATATQASAFQAAGFGSHLFRELPHGNGVLHEGYERLAPMPFVIFCMRYAGECDADGSATSVTMTSEKFAELTTVNQHVNAAIRPQSMPYATHAWTLGADVGDCNEFAIEKRHELIAAGWPAAALALTIVKTPWHEGHLVVTVRTDRGDLVLDSLRRDVVAWSDTRYEWIMRQSATNPIAWVSLDATDPAPKDVPQHDERVLDAGLTEEAIPSASIARDFVPVAATTDASVTPLQTATIQVATTMRSR